MGGKPTDSSYRRSDREVVPAIDPETGKAMSVYITHRDMDRTARRGMGAALELAETVRFTLLNPKNIYRGVREEGEVDWLCYCSVPPCRYILSTGSEGSVPLDRVFLVFVNDDHVAYAWYWTQCDPRDRYQPMGYDTRFDRTAL
jgi:hypothetical protein